MLVELLKFCTAKAKLWQIWQEMRLRGDGWKENRLDGDKKQEEVTEDQPRVTYSKVSYIKLLVKLLIR